jgi:hypothetical protein
MTLSLKSASFNESPSNVCSFVSRSSGDKLTNAPGGGTGAAFLGGAARLAGALPVVVTSVELQLDNPKAPIKTTPTSVSIMRPGVQNDFQPAGLEEEGFEKAI